jgi:hypothetical protein
MVRFRHPWWRFLTIAEKAYSATNRNSFPVVSDVE